MGDSDDKCGGGSSEEDLNKKVDDDYLAEPDNFKERIIDDNVSDLFELCKSKCPVKYLSVLLYMTLRNFNVSWRNCDIFLRKIGESLK
jgi:hypothetical protein